MIAALVVGTLLAVGALGFVLYPLFFGAPAPRRRGAPAPVEPATPAVTALRELEFDRATGKLTEADYAGLRAQYVPAALAELDATTKQLPAQDDPVEAAVLAYRASHRECPKCGPRPERDASYCSECGEFLDARCARCRAHVEIAGATFCPSCGGRLAA